MAQAEALPIGWHHLIGWGGMGWGGSAGLLRRRGPGAQRVRERRRFTRVPRRCALSSCVTSPDRLSVIVPAELGAAIRRLAAARGETVSTIVTEAIDHRIRLAALDDALEAAERCFGRVDDVRVDEAEAKLVAALRRGRERGPRGEPARLRLRSLHRVRARRRCGAALPHGRTSCGPRSLHERSGALLLGSGNPSIIASTLDEGARWSRSGRVDRGRQRAAHEGGHQSHA